MNQRTYADKLISDKSFREDFEQEYKNLVISEKIAELRHKVRDSKIEVRRGGLREGWHNSLHFSEDI